MSAELSASLDLEAAVLAAIASVDDPEYPGISIVDLGLLEHLDVAADGSASIELVPTFAGCPALDVIAGDVTDAVQAVPGVTDAAVRWVRTSSWTPERLSARCRTQLAESFTVAVEISPRRAECPRCGAPTTERSMFGPSRCRSVHHCDSCRETIEVMRA